MVRRLAVVILALVLPALPAAPQESEEVLGAPAAFGDALGEERVPVPAGSTLRELPDRRAPALATVDAPSELPLLERRGGWARVRYGALNGWVLLEEPAGSGGGPDIPGPPGALPGRRADPELLARALSRLGGSGEPEPGRLGPFVFYTDLDDPEFAGLLDRVVEETLRLYRERYGLDPGLGADPQAPRETVVLFHREADYRAFAQGDAALAGLEEEGLAGFGLAALHVGSRSREEVASLLVHEVVHLLNRRALGARTPPWLEEGLADALSLARIDASGRLHPEELGGRVRQHRAERRDAGGRRVGWEITVTRAGGRAALAGLVEALEEGTLPSLAALTALSWRELVEPAAREVAYGESAFFVRWLLDDEETAAGFRTYLRSVAAGGAGGGPDLLRALNRPDGDWESLDRRFRRWLRAEALRGDR